jgi:Flp pilus assembly protein TadG
MPFLNKAVRAIPSAFRVMATRKRAGRRGVSAIEFALIAPVMVLSLFGASEISLAVTMDRKTALAASALGDLAAQVELVSCAELTQIGTVTRQVFEPYSGNSATLVVASLKLDGGVPKVEWSKFLRTDTASGAVVCDDVPSSHALYVGKTVSVNPNIFAVGGGIVVGDVEIVHTSMGTSFMANNITLRERFYLRPRKSLKLKLCTQTGPSVTADNCTSTT